VLRRLRVKGAKVPEVASWTLGPWPWGSSGLGCVVVWVGDGCDGGGVSRRPVGWTERGRGVSRQGR
jgi:hypothetical protein